MLRGVPTLTLNYSLEIPQPKAIPLDWLALPDNQTFTTLDLHLPLGQTQLTLPYYEALKVQTGTGIVAEIDEVQAGIGQNPFPWWAWLLIAIGGSIALIIFVKYCSTIICKFVRNSGKPLQKRRCILR